MGACIFVLENNWLDFSAFDAYKVAQPSIVLDDDGAELARFELDKRPPVPFDHLPEILVKAFIAAEDHTFFTHSGVSIRGIARSFLVNVYNRRVVQGASTITQQLARLMFLSYERTWYRKFREVLIAFQLERQLSKQQILELYLNNIYFGRGIYGVQTACRRIWNKNLDQITVAQAATLAAVAASARLYSPLNAPANAKRRRNIILGSMKKLGFIEPDVYNTAIEESLEIHDYAFGNGMRMYIQEWVRLWAENKWGRDALYGNGLKIKTTINVPIQEKAEKAFNNVVHRMRSIMGNQLNGALMSITPETGHVKALIGGYDFKQSQYNRALQARRQMGSSFKPILYALAMKAGILMDRVYVDEPMEFVMPSGSVWKPKNWNNQFDGPMTLARAITFSVNTIAIKLFLEIGAEYVIPWAKRFGITHCMTPYPSAALGTAEPTVEENVAAFNVFANNGVYVKPILIEWVKDVQGKKIYESTINSYRVIDARTNSKMVNLLSQRSVLRKKHSPDDWFDAESITKSGSTNGAATTWYVGATPELTTALYVGRDDNKPMGSQMLAARTTFPIWAEFYKSLECKKKHFYKDPSLREVTIDWVTGEHVNPGTVSKNAVVLLQD